MVSFPWEVMYADFFCFWLKETSHARTQGSWFECGVIANARSADARKVMRGPRRRNSLGHGDLPECSPALS